MNDQKDIARKIRSGDEQAFELMFRAHYSGMCGYANKYLMDLDQAEEIVQDVFFNYWNKRTSLEITGVVEAYLYRAVRNSCLNYLKHLNIRKTYASTHAQVLKDEENKNYDKVIELELQQKIDKCIDELPPERQKIFKMSRHNGLKYREIADQLSISVKTVEAQMAKALKFMRENLSEYLPVLFLATGIYIAHFWHWIMNNLYYG